MTAPQKFRSAINGFNREDVVHYIEFSNSRHVAEVTQLKEQLDKAQMKLVSEADPYRVLELIQFSGVRTTVTETGAIVVEATAKLRRALKLYDELNAVVDGAVIVEIRDNSTCVGEAKMEA